MILKGIHIRLTSLFLLIALSTFYTHSLSAEEKLSYKDALILGVVEGITEYLPISSTGHLILCNEYLGLNQDKELYQESGDPILNPDGSPYTLKQAADAYAIIIQGGAILAVLILYWKRIQMLFKGLIGKSKRGQKLLRNLVAAFIPAAILGLLFDDLIETYLFGIYPVIAALIAGAFLMLFVEKRLNKSSAKKDDSFDLDDLSVKQCLSIGLMQCVAMWPGTSRSMMTIVGGYVAGLTPVLAAEFSFLLGLITLSAASGYKILKGGTLMMQALEWQPVMLGLFAAFIAAALSIKWLVQYLTRHGLGLFAWYRIALAICVFALMR